VRIKNIKLEWFRGAADQIALDPDCKSLVVYGANGSGKSSFVDGVEYLLHKGKIGHLSHEYSGRHQEKAIPNTHKPKDDRWLKRHPLVHFHFIPTYSSWLNQVEVWFSILSRQALRGASFTSPAQLRQAIDDFVKVHNEKAAPFEWKKAVVFPSAPKAKYANLCK